MIRLMGMARRRILRRRMTMLMIMVIAIRMMKSTMLGTMISIMEGVSLSQVMCTEGVGGEGVMAHGGR